MENNRSLSSDECHVCADSGLGDVSVEKSHPSLRREEETGRAEQRSGEEQQPVGSIDLQ